MEEGDRVTRDQVLARLHTSLLEAQLAAAKAWRDAQQQVLARLEAGSRPRTSARPRPTWMQRGQRPGSPN